MNKIFKYTALSICLFFIANAHPRNSNITEKIKPEVMCFENNESNFKILKSYVPLIKTTREQLLAQCLKNSEEIAMFNSYNMIEKTEDLYEDTVTKLNARLDKILETANDDIDMIRQYYCFEKILNVDLPFAKRIGEKDFLRRSLMNINNMLRNYCAS